MKNQEYITIFGLFSKTIFLLYEKAFEVYLKRDDGKENFQVSPSEVEFSCSAILLLITGLNSYFRRIEYLIQKKAITSNNFISRLNTKRCKKCKRIIYPDMISIITDLIHFEIKDNLKTKEVFLNKGYLKQILVETFNLRNIIAHNHLYELHLKYDKEYNPEWKYKSLEKEKKFEGKEKRSKLLKLNNIPIQINFIDLNKVFVIFDLVMKLLSNIFPRKVNFNFFIYKKPENEYIDSMKEFFDIYLTKIKNANKSTKELTDFISSLKKKILSYKDKEDLVKNMRVHVELANLIDGSIIDGIQPCKKCSHDRYFYNISKKRNNCFVCGHSPSENISIQSH